MTLIFGVAMAIVIIVLGTFVYLRFKADLLASIDFGLRSRAQVLSDAAGRTAEQDVVVAPGKLIDPDEAFAQVVDGTGSIVDTSPIVAHAALIPASDLLAVDSPTFFTRQVEGFDDPLRLLAVPVAGRTPPDVIVVGTNLGDMDDALGRLVEILAIVGPVTVLTTITAAWLLTGAALRPVERMRREATAISASDPARRLLDPGTGDELGRLAATLNAMLDRLQQAVERERRFVDEASHELRTPLATLRAEVDLALTRQRSTPDLEAALRSVRDDVERLQLLAEDLLVLARSRGGRIPLRRIEVRLDEMLDRGVRAVEPSSRAAEVAIEIDAPGLTVLLDPDRVEQALRNLLENAIRYSPRGGTVHLSASAQASMVRIIVADSGPGFPPDLVDHAFDEFRRGSEWRQDERGTGLGLAIVRAVAEAHAGAVWAENSPDGALVTLELHT